jgi:glycerophosphoryl diester phosphodiesterase
MTDRRPLVLGHRGSPRIARENTLAAFAAARDQGADGVELDVHRSADGVLVVHHDADADGVGVLAEVPFDRIRAAAPWLPTLAEVLDECEGILVNVEIKNSPRDADFDPTETVTEAVVALLGARGGRDRILVSSFHLPSIDRVRSRAPEWETAYLTVVDPTPEDALALAVAGGHRAIHPFFGVLADERAATVCEAAHAQGIAVNVWTVNEPEDMLRLAAAGVDAIVTDVPDVAREVFGG